MIEEMQNSDARGDPAPCVVTHHRVLYSDVDSMNIMYYGNYFRLFERAWSELWRHCGLACSELEERGLILPVTEAKCHYIRSAHYDDLLFVEARVSEIRRASVRFHYEIFRDKERKEKLVDGYTLHACLNNQNQVVRMPDYVRSALTHTTPTDGPPEEK